MIQDLNLSSSLLYCSRFMRVGYSNE